MTSAFLIYWNVQDSWGICSLSHTQRGGREIQFGNFGGTLGILLGEDSGTSNNTYSNAADASRHSRSTFIYTTGLQGLAPTSGVPSCSIVTPRLWSEPPWWWTWAAAAVAPAAQWPGSGWRAGHPPETRHTALCLGSWCPSSPRYERHKRASRKTQRGIWGPAEGPETQTPLVGLPWVGERKEPRSQSGEWGV